MERIYAVTLDFNQPMPHSSFETNLATYLHSTGLFLPEETTILGSNLYVKTEGGHYIRFTLSDASFESPWLLLESEAIKYALEMARKLTSLRPPFENPLIFNPNLIYLFVGRDAEWNYMDFKDFIPDAKKLQNQLYGGGSTALSESSGHFGFFLGIKEQFKGRNFKELIEVGGIAKPATSLDDLLLRLG